MPKQIEKTEISQGPRDQNLWIYAGWLDIANAAENWDTLLTLTKLYALFYERIVVFDGYFHCNGPLFTALKRAASAGSNPTRRWTEEFLQEHEILKLLFEGIVVPAHRDGPSMADTFANGRRGIAPGEFMSVEKKVGQAVLEMVDELARYYYIQPKISAGKFHEALWDSLTDDQTLIGQVLSHPQVVEKDGFLQRDIAIRVCCILDDFHDQLTIAKGQSDFRRGWVEKWAAKTLDMPLHSYKEFSDRIHPDFPVKTAPEATVLVLLNSVSTAYELMHAESFHCLAGLFNSHDRDIPELKIMRQSVTATKSIGPRVSRPLQLSELPKTNGLTAKDVVQFRASDIFSKYCALVRNLQLPADGETLLDANPLFEKFLFDEYAKAIVSLLLRAPKKSALIAGSVVFGTGGAATFNYFSALEAEGVELYGISIMQLLRGAAAAATLVGTGAALGPLVIQKSQQFRALNRFKNNNYHLVTAI